MSILTVLPEYLSSAATDLAGIGSALGSAGSAAASATTSVLPAGADEISAAIATLFGAHGQEFQSLSAQASKFHDQFVQAIRSAGAAYSGAEAANVSPLQAIAATASPMRQLEQAQIAFNSNLVANELAFNRALVTNEVAFERQFFGTDSALNGALNRSFNVGNLLVGTGEQTLNLFTGASVPVNFTSGLLLGTGAQSFNGGQIGGLVGAFDQSLMVPADLLGLAAGNTSPTAASFSPLQAVAAAGGPFQGFEQTQITFNQNLVANELAFNHALVTNEVAWEQQVFHTDSALNGLLNRSFNVGNLLVGSGEQAVNLFFGPQVPANFTSSLLLGSGAQSFNGGQIGGLLGAFDQSVMAGADLVGLITGA
ncbi:PE family protein [Mycobacterium sp. ML4]